MQQQYRIRKNGHFRFVYRRGRHASGKLIRLHAVKARRVMVGVCPMGATTGVRALRVIDGRARRGADASADLR